MFDKILIANRGEIAVRIAKTCRRLGVRTVAVFSDADATAQHVRYTDEAKYIGKPPATESYLVGERIIEAAKSTGAQAVHPGYGFLSENANFADLCASEGLVFIGPPASAIRAMGSKSGSKFIMTDAGVPCTPGYHGSDQSMETLKREAKRCGFPLMLKADAGGGGKGMRIVERFEDFEEAAASCRREALSSFKDDKILMERYVRKARHVEFQIFGDTHGNYVHLHERDCSVQRRHQKVLEEAPAPFLPSLLKERMGQAAVQAARAVGYVGAGTVEFMVDAEDRGANPFSSNDEAAIPEFYFMEMNTRLQVEHPVTEMVTGVDLVEWQLKVASGQELPLTQEQIELKGHSIEARVYAENPAGGFLPGAGKLRYLSEPDVSDGNTRVETGVKQGDDISIYYDPMIAKLVVRGENRAEALRLMQARLREYRVAGLSTNLDFIQACVAHPKFKQGGVATDFIAENVDDLLPKPTVQKTGGGAFSGLGYGEIDSRVVVAAAVLANRASQTQAQASNAPFYAFRNANPTDAPLTRLEYIVPNVKTEAGNTPGLALEVAWEPSAPGSDIHACDIHVTDLPSHGEKGPHNNCRAIGRARNDPANPACHVVDVAVDGTDLITDLRVVTLKNELTGALTTTVFSGGKGGLAHLSYVIERPAPNFAKRGKAGAAGAAGPKTVRAPMPGKITRVLVKVGDTVAADQPLVSMEAMKMEHILKASSAGKVEHVLVSPGTLVGDGQDCVVVGAA